MDDLYTVSKLFSDRIFCVPDYQRGYAWEGKHCQDFVDDLDLLGENKEHFLGLLILRLRNGDGAKLRDQAGEVYQLFDIVDGQQRLTTLVVLLQEMRKEMARFESLQEMANASRRIYLEVTDANGLARPKLSLGRDTRAFFLNTILEHGLDIAGPTIRSHQLLAAAKEFFRGYLQKRSEKLAEAYPEWLKSQYQKITQQLKLVLYEIESEADAGVVFETMNNRGKPLTELEKVKNYLLYLATKLDLPAETNLAEEINKTWTWIYEHLMAAGLSAVEYEDRLLRAHWLMAYHYDTTHPQGYEAIKKQFALSEFQGDHQALLVELKRYLSSLHDAAVAMCEVYAPGHSSAFTLWKEEPDLRRQIVTAGERLARLGAPVTFLPLLMAARLRESTNGRAYLRILEVCERFAFRVYQWAERPAYTGRSLFYRLGYQVFHQEEDLEKAMGELERAILNYCSDKRFAERFESAEVNWFRWRGLRYLLYEYEQHLADQKRERVEVSWSELEEREARKEKTVEHILPQHPEAGGYWSRHFSKKQAERWLNDIGNLTLTYFNPVLGIKPFPEKKGVAGSGKCYSTSKLHIEQQIAAYEHWTPKTIQARREEIRAWAQARWHVEPPAGPAPGGDEDETELVLRAVTRRFIPRGQLLLYSVLYRAGEEGVPSDELPTRLGVSQKGLSGILGALGNRINQTEGMGDNRGIGWLLEWRVVDGLAYYVMRPVLRAAIDSLPELCEAVAQWPEDEIDRRYAEDWGVSWQAQNDDLGLTG